MTYYGHEMAVKPIYAVLFATASEGDAPSLPFATERYGVGAGVTAPHGFDRDMAAALPGMWYCLHLPKTLFDLVDVPASALKKSQQLHLDHRILVCPIGLFDVEHLGDWPPPFTKPALVTCPDSLAEAAASKAASLNFPFAPVSYSTLSNESLTRHWRELQAELAPGVEYLGREPQLASRLDFQPVDLPRRWLARQWGADQDPWPPEDGTERLLDAVMWQQVVLAATARLEEEGTTPQVAEGEMPRALEEEVMRVRVPMAVGLPGVPSAYSRRAYDESLRARIEVLPAHDEADTWSLNIDGRSDALIERSAIEFVTTHRALARGGVGLMLPSVPQQAFSLLAALENHFRGTPGGRQVRRLLGQLHKATEAMWTDTPADVVARASMLTVFSNFPLGLLRLPGDTDPLSCRIPISYRPVLPLTRSVQFELADEGGVDLTGGFHVLVVECIPATDPVGRLSRIGWETASEIVRRTASSQAITLDYVETPSLDVLRGAIGDARPEVLVLSAHGAMDTSGSTAGIVVGDRLCLGPELGQMPPVVILSACQVAPRGGGAIAITDLLHREGAIAVLGTQVPIDVRHNAMLMSRFFLYMCEVLTGRENHSSLIEIWHRVQTSNAINDILNGSVALSRWAHDQNRPGGAVIEEFMNVRSREGIRLGHVYEDTERMLLAIADDEGDGTRIQSLLRSPGYVPESLFYSFVGRPERVLLRSPIPMPKEVWEEMRQRDTKSP